MQKEDIGTNYYPIKRIQKKLKAISRNARPSRNITVTNCVLTSSSTPLKIGTATVETEISHVLFQNCVIRNSNKGFGIDVLDGATVSDIVFSNLTIETSRRHWNWWGNAEMCKIVLDKRNPSSKLAGTHAFMHLKGERSKDIRLKNNRLTNADKEIAFEHSSLENAIQLK